MSQKFKENLMYKNIYYYYQLNYNYNNENNYTNNMNYSNYYSQQNGQELPKKYPRRIFRRQNLQYSNEPLNIESNRASNRKNFINQNRIASYIPNTNDYRKNIVSLHSEKVYRIPDIDTIKILFKIAS
jgi:hypothetical protein